MKRQIATLLTFATVLALASCSKEGKSKKSPKFSLSSLSTTETTPETTETSAETTTETTMDSTTATSETTPSVSSGSFTIDHSLEYLEVENTPFATCYGYCKQTEDFERMFYVQEYGDLYFVGIDGYSALDTAVFDIYNSIFTPQDEAYVREFDTFVESLHLTGDANPSMCISEIEVYRADSQIYSFVIDEYLTGKDYNYENHYGYYSYNLRSSDGSLIQLSDVIIDPEAFCTYLEQYIASTPGNGIFGKTEDINLEEITQEIRNGQALFVLSYDSIFLFQGSRFFKVPVYPTENIGCIDMSYFGSTPEHYALQFDHTGTLDWDINGDGTMDTISVEYVRSAEVDFGGTVEQIIVSINGQAAPLAIDEFDPYVFDASVYLIQSDDGLYLFLSNSGMDSYATDYIFRIDGDQVTYVTQIYSRLDKIIYNPEYIECCDYYDLIGSTALYYYYTLTSNQGEPLLLYYTFPSYGYLAATSKDLTVDKVDIETGDVIGQGTIPVNTPVETVFYNYETDSIYFQTLHENSEENEYFVIPNDHDFIIESFKGMVFAG